MSREDIKNLVIFIILIVLIILVLFIYNKDNKKLDSVDRKVKYINNIPYNTIYNRSIDLFFNTIDLINGNGVKYEMDSNNHLRKFNINNKEYIKIDNMDYINSIMNISEVNKFIKYNNILEYDGNYYIKDKINNNINYIGSIISNSYNSDEYLIFESENYYCDNYKYIGELDKEPSCNYNIKKSNFKITMDNNNLLIDNIDELYKIFEQ